MAIIRSKIARQLLAEGGAPRRKGFMFGSGRGSTAEAMSEAAFSPDTFSGFSGDYGGFSSPADSSPPPSSDPNTMDDTADVNLGLDVSRKPAFTPPDPDDDRGFFAALSNPRKALSIRYIENELDRRKNFDKTLAGELGFKPNETPFDDKFLSRTQELEAALNLAKRGINVTDIIQKGRPGYNENREGDSEPMIKLRAPITEKIEEKPKDEFADILKFYGARFEDGGDVRQEYGLGSIVKKATRAVKKVVKSPLGKAAIFGAAAFGLPAIGSFGGTPGFLKSQLGKKIFFGGKEAALANLNPFSAITAASLLAGSLAKEDEEEEKLPTVANTDPEMTKFIDFYGGPRRFAEDGGDIEDAPMKTASMPSTFGELNQLSIDLFGRPYDQLNDSEQEILIEYFTKGKKQGIERATAAMGGMMEKDEMLDLGGKEMDLRGGGFVPLGEYEKKDDVPARLSKNEFVFTADAVRAAGGGSVDRGADIMYKTMKNLENKVA